MKANKKHVRLSFFFFLTIVFLIGCTNTSFAPVVNLFRKTPARAELFSAMDTDLANKFLGDYRAELDHLGQTNQTHPLPDIPFFLFGMGNRQKMLYKDGVLKDLSTGQAINKWDVAEEIILPSEYMVVIKDNSGQTNLIVEDEECVWLYQGSQFSCITAGKLHLPDFSNYTYPGIMRVLHHEILVNIKDHMPLPNVLVYSTPWYRDAASIAMVLVQTGNMDLITPWIRGITDPFDRNNGGIEEADNLGQVLYLVSLINNDNHPVIQKVFENVQQFSSGNHIDGLTDFGSHPVYQTAWLKYGIAQLGLEDPFEIPDISDSYGGLFWMDYHESINLEQSIFDSAVNYPYLTWAEDHFFGNYHGRFSDQIYPLTWESQASSAQYEGMEIVAEEYVNTQTAVPHAWHAAEMFLVLAEGDYPW